MTTRREFLSDIAHRIRFVYLPKHSSWLNQIEIFFGITHRKCLRGGNFTSVADLESQLRQFIIYYNTTMAHPFDWTYTGKPLETIARDTERDFFMGAEDAVKYGIVDKVLTSRENA